jgi:hypothetical protein
VSARSNKAASVIAAIGLTRSDNLLEHRDGGLLGRRCIQSKPLIRHHILTLEA